MKLETHVTMTSWVVTHRSHIDDEESLHRAIMDYSPNATDAWKKFIRLVGGTKSKWNRLGYVAKRVQITARI